MAGNGSEACYSVRETLDGGFVAGKAGAAGAGATLQHVGTGLGMAVKIDLASGSADTVTIPCPEECSRG